LKSEEIESIENANTRFGQSLGLINRAF